MNATLLLFITCALSSIAIPVPEDVPLLAAGTQIEDGWMLVGFLIAGALGVFCRDAFWFGLGHIAGEGALRWGLIRRMLGDERIAKAKGLVDRQGGRAIIAARFLIGFRSPAFLVAGALGVRIRHFVMWDGLGVLITTPIYLALGYLVGAPVNQAFTWLMDHRPLLLAFGLILAVAWGTSQMSRRRKKAAALAAADTLAPSD